jgi:rare lipoprotein A
MDIDLNTLIAHKELQYQEVRKEQKYHIASWYGNEFHGRLTANGERFNQYDFTAAHRTLPFGTRLIVVHNDKSIVVRINDRGPFIRSREIDLSKGAAMRLGLKGIGRVTLIRI